MERDIESDSEQAVRIGGRREKSEEFTIRKLLFRHMACADYRIGKHAYSVLYGAHVACGVPNRLFGVPAIRPSLFGAPSGSGVATAYEGRIAGRIAYSAYSVKHKPHVTFE